jgi:hypothetical protein
MTPIAWLVSLLASVTPGAATPNTPEGWEITKVPARSVTWAAPKGWKLSHQLPVGMAPSSLSIEGKANGELEGWLTVEALVSGNGSADELLAKRPRGVANVTTEDGWTCGEEPGTGTEVVCASVGDLVTTVIWLGGDSQQVVAKMGGVAALRKVAPMIRGVWPRGLPQPDAAGHLPPVEWTRSASADGRVTWMTPKGWTAAQGATMSPVSTVSFNAAAGTGAFSITVLPGLQGVATAEAPIAEERVIKFLVPDAALTRADGWTCGEGMEKSSGLPAIICNKLTPEGGLYVSVRAEPVVFQTIGGVGSVRSAAAHVQGFSF